MCGGCGYARRVGRSVVAGLVVRSGVGAVASVRGSGGVCSGSPGCGCPQQQHLPDPTYYLLQNSN